MGLNAILTAVFAPAVLTAMRLICLDLWEKLPAPACPPLLQLADAPNRIVGKSRRQSARRFAAYRCRITCRRVGEEMQHSSATCQLREAMRVGALGEMSAGRNRPESRCDHRGAESRQRWWS
jgi:hypothetical protein